MKVSKESNFMGFNMKVNFEELIFSLIDSRLSTLRNPRMTSLLVSKFSA